MQTLNDVSERERASRSESLRTTSTPQPPRAELYAVLGAVAQFERKRDVLRERTVAGMLATKSRGEHIGRPAALTPAQVCEAK